ncbi:MAG: hypothetical protein AB7J28_07965 [Hyphomonadaceae bacterium]
MRTILCSALAFCALAAPAAAQQGTAPVGMEVRGDDGALLGRVTGVSRDAEGNVIGVAIAGLEPAAAARPTHQRPSQPMIVRNEPRQPAQREARVIRRENSITFVSNR